VSINVDNLAKALGVDASAFEGLDVRGCAVLVATGWDRHWGGDAYYHDHSFLTVAAAAAERQIGRPYMSSFKFFPGHESSPSLHRPDRDSEKHPRFNDAGD